MGFSSTRTSGDAKAQSRAIAVDASGKVYIAGAFSGALNIADQSPLAAGECELLLATYNADGTLAAARRVATGNAAPIDLATDRDGNRYVVGTYWDPTTFRTDTELPMPNLGGFGGVTATDGLFIARFAPTIDRLRGSNAPTRPKRTALARATSPLTKRATCTSSPSRLRVHRSDLVPHSLRAKDGARSLCGVEPLMTRKSPHVRRSSKIMLATVQPGCLPYVPGAMGISQGLKAFAVTLLLGSSVACGGSAGSSPKAKVADPGAKDTTAEAEPAVHPTPPVSEEAPPRKMSGFAAPTVSVSDDVTCVVSEGKATCRDARRQPVTLPFDDVTGVFAVGVFELCVATSTGVSCGLLDHKGKWESVVKIERPGVIEARFHIPDVSVVAGTLCTLDASQAFRCDRFSEAGIEKEFSEDGVSDFAMGPFGGICWTEGKVNCIAGPVWGKSDYGQHRGAGAATPVPGIADARRVSIGGSRACVAHETGEVSCWGYGWESNNDEPSPAVQRLPKVAGVQDLVVGDYSLCVASDKGLSCWGDNYLQTLGPNRPRFEEEPVWIEGMAKWRSFDLAATRICGMNAEGELRCAGEDIHRAKPAPLPDPLLVGRGLAEAFVLEPDVVCASKADAPTQKLCLGRRYDHEYIRGVWWKPGVGAFKEIEGDCVRTESGELMCRLGTDSPLAPPGVKMEPWRLADDASALAVDPADGVHGCFATRSGQLRCFSMSTGEQEVADVSGFTDVVDVWMSSSDNRDEEQHVCVLRRDKTGQCFELPVLDEWPEELAPTQVTALGPLSDADTLRGNGEMVCAKESQAVACWAHDRLSSPPVFRKTMEVHSFALAGHSSYNTPRVIVLDAAGKLTVFDVESGDRVKLGDPDLGWEALVGGEPIMHVSANPWRVCTTDQVGDVRCLFRSGNSSDEMLRSGMQPLRNLMWPAQSVDKRTFEPARD